MMPLIDLKQHEDVTFPDPNILQKNVEEILVAFRCLKELCVKYSATEENITELNHLSSIFDELIMERAKESLKMSMYLEEILDYFQMLIKEDTSVEDLLKTLATLKDMVKNRIVDSEKLENQFKEFKTEIKKINDNQSFDVHGDDKKVFLLQDLIIKDRNQSENFQGALKSFLIEVAKTTSSILYEVAKVSFLIFILKKFLQLLNVNLIIYGNSINSYQRNLMGGGKFAKIRENKSSYILEQISSYNNGMVGGNSINNDDNNSIASNESSTSYSLANLFPNNLPINLACRLVLGYYYFNYNPKELFSRFQRKHAKTVKEYNDKITNKLPIIITNLTILTQFWKHQSIIIDSHINSLESLNNKNKVFRLPENLINGFIKRWREEQIHCKESRLILNNFVTQNSLLNSDSK
ncbi:7661_t:CDS:2 [Entrophospora sp. SA101]|nr:7661_t:CDS:2 [Entrophospora sp. SA101]